MKDRIGSRCAWLEATEEESAGGMAMGCEPWDSLVMVRARSGCEEEMLGALFLQEEKPEPELDILKLLWPTRLGGERAGRSTMALVAALIACGDERQQGVRRGGCRVGRGLESRGDCHVWRTRRYYHEKEANNCKSAPSVRGLHVQTEGFLIAGDEGLVSMTLQFPGGV